MIHVTPLNVEEWRLGGWNSAASATCDVDGCDGYQLIGIFKEDAWAATMKYGELALKRKLEEAFHWRNGKCPVHEESPPE